MKALRELTVHLTLRGPVLTKSTAPSSFGVDAAAARHFRTGRPCLPGTLVKGKVREALGQLGETAVDLDRLFGGQPHDGGSDEPERGALKFEDLVAQANGRKASLHRVALDDTLGSAKGQMLRVIETPYLAGENVCFSGTARCYADDDEAKKVATTLRLGLRWLVQAGSLRTTGFGRVLDANVVLEPLAAPAQTVVISAAPLALELELRPQGSLCIARHKIGDNLFESEDIIPGNMLAGAIMETAKALGIDGSLSGFEKIRFRHAFPTTGGDRPRAMPLSTVKAGKIAYDIAGFRDPVLLADDSGGFTAPAFPLDWKEHGDVLGKLGWALPSRELRVRTAIDSRKRTVDRGDGQGGRLFAWEVIHPVTDVGTDIVWRTRIDLKAASDRAAMAKALVQVLTQLGFVSKTKARCEVKVTGVLQATSVPKLTNGQSLALVLQTPTLLADPRFQSVADVPKSGALSADQMRALYRAAWSELSDDSLNLSHHFAQQFLAGGNYLARRFQKDRAYDPWLLTKEGSVFAFTVRDAAKAMKCLEDWLATGLPLPTWAVHRYGTEWHRNPYRPENGFGEIAVHTAVFATPTTQPVNLAEPVLS